MFLYTEKRSARFSPADEKFRLPKSVRRHVTLRGLGGLFSASKPTGFMSLSCVPPQFWVNNQALPVRVLAAAAVTTVPSEPRKKS